MVHGLRSADRCSPPRLPGAGREILFTSASFLRSLGLPGTTRQEIDRSPLIYQDVLELLVAPSAPTPNSTATKELRAHVKQALADAVACNFECGFQFRGKVRCAFPRRTAPRRGNEEGERQLTASCGPVQRVVGQAPAHERSLAPRAPAQHARRGGRRHCCVRPRRLSNTVLEHLLILWRSTRDCRMG